MSKADRIARERLEAARSASASAERDRAERQQAEAREQLATIRSLSDQVLAALAKTGYGDPEPEPLSIAVHRFAPLGNLFGERTVVKGGWKIASWKFDRERSPHTVWLLSDGRYCWNREIVNRTKFTNWHDSAYVAQGPAAMVAGMRELLAVVGQGIGWAGPETR